MNSHPHHTKGTHLSDGLGGDFLPWVFELRRGWPWFRRLRFFWGYTKERAKKLKGKKWMGGWRRWCMVCESGQAREREKKKEKEKEKENPLFLWLCKEPKSSRNNNWEKYNWDWERKRMEARIFHVVRLCEPTSTGCSQWATPLLIFFLYDILDDYNVL